MFSVLQCEKNRNTVFRCIIFLVFEKLMEGNILIVLENIFKNPAMLMNLSEFQKNDQVSLHQKTQV